MASDHSHHHHHHLENSGEIKGGSLLAAILLNFIITLAEIIGGILSNSLALISDALHNFSDTLSLAIAYGAHKVGKREHTTSKTFGYKRIEILAALFNAAALVGICIYLFYEAYERLMHPEPIKGSLMMIIATIGLFANLFAVIILNKDKKKNINIKAAYLHLLGDTLSSVGVIIGGVLIWFYKIYWLDPLLTILIGLYILKETYSVLKETIEILMQGAPADLDIESIKNELQSLQGVEDIHHMHVWRMDDKNIHFECHLDLSEDMLVSHTDKIRSKAEHILKEHYGIGHVTIQVELRCCDDKGFISQEYHKK